MSSTSTSASSASSAASAWLRAPPFCNWYYQSLLDLGRQRQLFALNDASVLHFLHTHAPEKRLDFFVSNARLSEAARTRKERDD